LSETPAIAETTSEIDLDSREQEELFDGLKRATIGEYDIYSKLGRGGMATVFLAMEIALNRPVAIKVISPSALSSSTIIERFWLEARTAASLSHPNVIPIYAVRSREGLHFFVMKHVQGGSLDLVLKNEGPLPIPLVRTILTQVSSALAYAHRRGVIHRDIKPGNIMLDDEGYSVVMDFGIAKVRDAAALTASGAMVGTPFYMSPEQFSGSEVDGRSDQYSLGVVAFELLTGQRPFKGETIAAVLRGHLLDKVPEIRTLRRDCPTALATLVNRMLAKAPTDRFASMEMVQSLLEQMPRIDSDDVRNRISELAKTASTSSPQIVSPISPTPLSRTSSSSIESKDVAQVARETITKAPRLLATRKIRWGLAVLISAAVALMLYAGQNDKNESRAPFIRIAPANVLRSQVTPLRPKLEADTTDARAQVPVVALTDTARELKPANHLDEAPKRHAGVPRSNSVATVPVSTAQPVHTAVGTEDSLTLVPPAPPPVIVPPEKRASYFRIGSRIESFLYIDGDLVGLLRGGLKTYQHDPGTVHVQIKAEDCMTYDTLFVLHEGDSSLVGWRQPRCNH
jgi:serine/threonine protein kinase